MLTKPKTSKKKIIIYCIIILLMVAGNIFIYYRNSQSGRLSLEEYGLEGDFNELMADSERTTPQRVEDSILEHKLFLTLQKIGDWPVVPYNVGKVDPFAPLFSE